MAIHKSSLMPPRKCKICGSDKSRQWIRDRWTPFTITGWLCTICYNSIAGAEKRLTFYMRTKVVQ